VRKAQHRTLHCIKWGSSTANRIEHLFPDSPPATMPRRYPSHTSHLTANILLLFVVHKFKMGYLRFYIPALHR
jgi:hypothetical protein